MTKICFYFMLPFLLFSCNKQETLTVRVKNAVTNAPITNHPINILEIYNSSDGVSGSKTKDFYTGHTNSEGILVVNEKFNKKRRYDVHVGAYSNGHCYINASSFIWTVGSNTEIDFNYAPCAYLKFRYQNVSCFDENDIVEVYRHTNLPDYAGFLVNAVYEGCVDYTMPNYVEVPMGWWYFEWTVTKDNITEVYNDSIYLNEGESSTYEINY